MKASWRVESKRHFARKGEPPTITRCLFVDAPEVTDSGKYRIAKLGENRFSLFRSGEEAAPPMGLKWQGRDSLQAGSQVSTCGDPGT